ncbi:hypothetical protein PoB_005616900 [Plakobranchus ocellatus]|uniref:Uncharacterized protein n=1 Tax=Plakobranchus ocellatus TaxID=259542 RepID=A0AAV4CEU2_9GAST|nr:hypothetical protein PoB_005616900 [Plakobranchus ocellatus]
MRRRRKEEYSHLFDKTILHWTSVSRICGNNGQAQANAKKSIFSHLLDKLPTIFTIKDSSKPTLFKIIPTSNPSLYFSAFFFDTASEPDSMAQFSMRLPQHLMKNYTESCESSSSIRRELCRVARLPPLEAGLGT